MKTQYEKWNKIKDNDIDVLTFYFKNSLKWQNYTVRKYKLGVKVTNNILNESMYCEKSHHNNIILCYGINNGTITEAKCEIVLDEFIDSLKRTHDLIKG